MRQEFSCLFDGQPGDQSGEDNKVNERGGQTVYRIYSELDGKPLEGFEHRNDMI